MQLKSLIGPAFLALSMTTLPATAQDKPPAPPADKPQDKSNGDRPKDKPEFPPFDEVAKDYEKVVSVADGTPSLYTVWVDKKRNQLLAELPRTWPNQKYFFAITQASGGVFA